MKRDKVSEDISGGILIINKSKGVTSHDVVAAVRKIGGYKKVGHAGTLDPNATGVLVLLIGRATKLSGRFTNQDKSYKALIELGRETDSGDVDGKTVRKCDIPALNEKDIEGALSKFRGRIRQIPPMYSAKKVKGKRLYRLARKGISIKRDPVEVEIKELEVVSYESPFLFLEVKCGKGTYIRQLATDIGNELGSGAYLKELERTAAGDFSIDNSLSFDDVLGMNKESINENIIRIN
jgi:tRNA pseudouridine55 synthase